MRALWSDKQNCSGNGSQKGCRFFAYSRKEASCLQLSFFVCFFIVTIQAFLLTVRASLLSVGSVSKKHLNGL